ncbi:hypothetical protein LCGC14_0850440 [marine sediment metagenome]|uniref:Uncharacterized protein n=1 Tax=marine sediment metagenome TaxID=412755 RepID=A0A0F9RV91_9ZZZZ
MQLTEKEIVQYRDRCFAATDHYELQAIAVEVFQRCGEQRLVDRTQKGEAFVFLAESWGLVSPDSKFLGVLFCCEAQYQFLGGEDQHGG